MHTHIVGIDEAGRGALAGPVAVGVALVPHNFDWGMLPDVRDSKQLSPKKREEIFICAQKLKRAGVIDIRVSLVSAGVVDTIGIVPAVQRGINRGLAKLSCNATDVSVRLDGGLRAPARFVHQETIIKGDQKEPAISLASVCAKVHRDRYMVRLAKKYPEYAFEVHKGYGTLRHRTCIAECGVSDIHRQYFCRGIDG